MNILFVTTYPLEYNTSANIRNIALIEGLLKLGHAVSTYSLYPEDARFFNKILSIGIKSRYWINKGDAIKSISTVQLSKWNVYVKKKACYVYSLFSIYDRRKSFVKQINSMLFNEKFDVVISSSDMKSAHLYVEELFKQDSSIANKWIQYWGDPLSNDISVKRLLPDFLVEKEEQRIISKCDKAVYVSPFTADMIKNKYPQLADKIDFLPIPVVETDENRSGTSSTKLLGYLGDYDTANRNIHPLLEVIINNNFDFVIAGNSDVKIESNDKIRVYKRMPVDEIEKMQQEIDIFICLCNKSGTQIPGKVYHYAATSKPVIVVLDGDRADDIAQFLSTFERYYLCNNRPDEILKCIKAAMNNHEAYSLPAVLKTENVAHAILAK